MKKQQSGLTNQVTFLLALTCGVVVANMYYIQPIGTQIAQGLSSQYWFYWFCYYADPIRLCASLLFLFH